MLHKIWETIKLIFVGLMMLFFLAGFAFFLNACEIQPTTQGVYECSSWERDRVFRFDTTDPETHIILTNNNGITFRFRDLFTNDKIVLNSLRHSDYNCDLIEDKSVYTP